MGVRKHGLKGYLKNLAPTEGIPGVIVPLLYVIEALTHAVRLLSLSLRLPSDKPPEDHGPRASPAPATPDLLALPVSLAASAAEREGERET